MSEHVVFGAGLIGCYLGGALTHQGLKTTLVCRPSVQKKLSEGLLLTDYHNHSESVRPSFYVMQQCNIADNIRPARILWLTVKCTGVEEACKDMTPWVDDKTVILCCQNGLGSEKTVKKYYPNNLVLRVMVPFNVAEIKPGHLHRGSEGSLTIERTSAAGQLVDRLVQNIQCRLLPVATSGDMTALLWAKLQLNLGNSINALADIPVKAMLEQRDYRRVIALMMQELLAVAAKLELKLPKVTSLPASFIPRVLTLPDSIFRLVANKMLAIDPNVRTSMWWDIRAGKRTEIDHLNGAITRVADGLGIATPVNKEIIDIIKEIEHKAGQGQRPAGIAADTLYQRVRTI